MMAIQLRTLKINLVQVISRITKVPALLPLPFKHVRGPSSLQPRRIPEDISPAPHTVRYVVPIKTTVCAVPDQGPRQRRPIRFFVSRERKRGTLLLQQVSGRRVVSQPQDLARLAQDSLERGKRDIRADNVLLHDGDEVVVVLDPEQDRVQ